MKRGRLEEAEDALERFVRINSSTVEGSTQLAQVRHDRGNKAGAQEAIAQAVQTFAQMPGYQRRKQIGWWLRAHLTKLTM